MRLRYTRPALADLQSILDKGDHRDTGVIDSALAAALGGMTAGEWRG